jgi:hypothetical protein
VPLATGSQGKADYCILNGAMNFSLDGGATWTPASSVSGGGSAFTDFVQDLGHSNRSGHFALTGLSGLTIGKDVIVVQTSQPIAAKGGARDELEMDAITATGYVASATTINVYWNATGTVVGPYAFAYQAGA